MTIATIHVLHVEDDRIQQAFVARHINSLPEYRFEIKTVSGEDSALEAFGQGNYELVIMDYHLEQGDGLSCLQKIRQIDAMIPIIAVSGVATNEIAAHLIEAGADDYLGKQSLDGQALCQSVKNVLIRARAFKSRFTPTATNKPSIASSTYADN